MDEMARDKYRKWEENVKKYNKSSMQRFKRNGTFWTKVH